MKGKNRFVLLLACMCFPASIFALSIPGAFAQSEDGLKLRVDVELVTVEVSALDRDGNPVRNLKREDFELYEDGKKQEIISIDEVNAETEIPSLGASPIYEDTKRQGKTILILFIDGTLGKKNVKASRDSAEKFVREHMRPQDLIAVGSYDHVMKILQNFTNDPEDVLAAIGRPADPELVEHYNASEFLCALERIIYSIGRLKGRKTLLLYTRAHHFPAYSSDSIYFKALNSARKANAVIYTIDPIAAIESDPVASQRIFTPSGLEISLPTGRPTTWQISQTTQKSLAIESGGSKITASDINSQMDKLDRQTSNYYILGFQSSNPKHDGSYRKLRVKTNLKGMTLKHRPGYQDRSPVDVLASSRQEKKLMTALASPAAASQLPVVFRPVYFYDSLRTARVLIAAKIRTEKLELRKKGEQLGTELNIMGAAYGEDGNIAARFSQTLPITVDKNKESAFRKQDFSYRNYFKLRPGKYRLKLAVSDESSNLGTVEQPLEVPAMPESGFAGSSLVLAEQSSRMPELIQDLKAQLLEEIDPLTYAGMQIEPSVGNRLPANSPVPVLFRIYNPAGGFDHWMLDAYAMLQDAVGKEYVTAPFSLQNNMIAAGRTEAAVSLNLAFRNVPPGKYRLIIKITEASSPQSAMIQTDIELF
ncbi:MAG: VWA domain-containing protein [Acidobacteria bacterium]|nr:VWA domain-containing protein [Acidobacteriota bacterium]